MACTSFQYGHGKADFAGGGLEPVGDGTLDEAEVRLDLGQLDRLILPLRSNGEGGDGHCGDHRHDQDENDDFSHSFTPLLLPSQLGRQPGCKHCPQTKTDTEHRSTSHIHPWQKPW